MKRYNSYLIIIISLYLAGAFCQPVKAAMSYGKVADYDVVLEIGPGGQIEVTENISHIYAPGGSKELKRILPRDNGSGSRIRISGWELFDSEGNELDAKIKKTSDEYELSFISNSESAVNYVLKYRVNKAVAAYGGAESQMKINWLGVFEANDIRQTKVLVRLPAALDESTFTAQCFSGEMQLDECVSTQYLYAEKGMVTDVVFVDDSLRAGKRLFLDLNVPSAALPGNTWLGTISSFLVGYGAYPAIVSTIGMLAFFYNKKRRSVRPRPARAGYYNKYGKK